MKLCKKHIEYAGITEPSTPAEIRIEIFGLRNAIKQAEELISRHEQALEIALIVGKISMEERQNDIEGEIDSGASGETQGKSDCPPLVR